MPNLSDKSSNVTDQTIASFWRECLPIHRELDDLKGAVRGKVGELRAVYKRAKENGVSSKALARLLRERSADPDEVTKELHDYVRTKAIVSPFPKEDVDMFATLLAPDLEEATRVAIDADKVYDDGVFAGSEGRKRDSNPHQPGTEHFDTWDRAYLIGQARNIKGAPAEPKRRGRPPKAQTGKIGDGGERAAPPVAEALAAE